MVMMVMMLGIEADLEYKKIDTPFSMPPRYLPAHAQLNNYWTFNGGGEHPSTEGSDLIMQTDLWDFDLSNNIWINKTGLATNSYPPAHSRAAVYRPSTSEYIFFGGSPADCSALYSIPRSFSSSASLSTSYVATHIPCPLSFHSHIIGHSLVLVPSSTPSDPTSFDTIYLFGGTEDLVDEIPPGIGLTFKLLLPINIRLSNLSHSDLKWVQIGTQSNAQPEARYYASLDYIQSQNQLILFGGTRHLKSATQSGYNFDDLWNFDLESETWTRIALDPTCHPEPRCLHATTPYSTFGLFIHGGVSEHAITFSNLWFYHVIDQKFVIFKTSGWKAPFREGHSMTYYNNSAGKEWIYIYGGDVEIGKPITSGQMWSVEVGKAKMGCGEGVGGIGECVGVWANCEGVDEDDTLAPGGEGKRGVILVVVIVVLVIGVGVLGWMGYYYWKKQQMNKVVEPMN
eukprot:TRINITY_DN18117_c0_g1_i1.p1 TRINITY_DN18117_c0_g1~~TRINITY_DN18117_c0_g1_i1.p1  ORF type:complete len:484 (-),score=131.84 TRINITY_DN18117_c0_g1_i1:49-1413(-)